jgi:hypothetical protein
VRAAVGEHVDGFTGPHHQHAQVAELPADRPPRWQLGERAQVVPAEHGQVVDGLGVARAGPEPERQVAPQVAAGGGRQQAAGRQDPAGAAPAGRAGQQRAGEQQRRARLGDGVHQADPLLVRVQRGPVRQPGGGGGHRRGHPGGGQGRRCPLRSRAAEQVE